MSGNQECKLCNGTGIHKNRVCYCVIANIFAEKAPHLLNVNKSKKLYTRLIKGEETLDDSYLVNLPSVEANQIIATYLIYKATICGELDFAFSNCLEAQDYIFNEGETISSLVKPNILVYNLLGVKHKALPTFLYQAFQTRIDKNKQTFIILANSKANRNLFSNYPELEPIIKQIGEIK